MDLHCVHHTHYVRYTQTPGTVHTLWWGVCLCVYLPALTPRGSRARHYATEQGARAGSATCATVRRCKRRLVLKESGSSACARRRSVRGGGESIGNGQTECDLKRRPASIEIGHGRGVRARTATLRGQNSLCNLERLDRHCHKQQLKGQAYNATSTLLLLFENGNPTISALFNRGGGCLAAYTNDGQGYGKSFLLC